MIELLNPELPSTANLKQTFEKAEPFAHIVMDHFLDASLANTLANSFPDAQSDFPWERFGHPGVEQKLASARVDLFAPALRACIEQLTSAEFITWLEQVTGINGLLPDPSYLGGGIHVSRPGDHLGIHADFNVHPESGLHRRLNLLIYLTPDWQAEWASELELWDRQGQTCVHRVEPQFNRAVLFATTSDSFHGHPRPLQGPANLQRRSIALYYYSKDRPESEKRPAHSTLYKGYHFD